MSWAQSLSRVLAGGAVHRRHAAAWVGLYGQAPHAWLAHVEHRPSGRPRLNSFGRLDDGDLARGTAAWQRARRAGGAAVNWLLGSAEYQLFQLDAPPVPPAEWAEATRWRLRSLIDADPEQAHLACLAIPDEDGADSGRMFAVVARREQLGREMLAARQARLPLRAIDVPELAVRNLLVLADDQPAQAMLFLGDDDAWIVVLWRQDLAATRRFEIGLAALAAADGEDHYQLVERLALEFQRTSDAFARQFTQSDLRVLWVCAGDTPPELVAALQGMLAVEVRPYVLADHVDDCAECPGDPGLRLAIGAALRRETEPA